MRTVQASVLFVLVVATRCVTTTGPDHTDPLSPAQALESFELVDGFEIELFASEPLVADPVEIAFDENGAAFVAEMFDYPFDPGHSVPPKSRISLLRDTDGDGLADRSTVFAGGLRNATSVLPWNGGVFVTAAPDILYLKDLDGDDKADLREVWYTGFNQNVSTEARVTNLRFGLDNWIYAANSAHQGTVTSVRFPQHPPVPVRGFDFRFHPLTGRFEPAGGPTQFGSSFTQWGERLVSQNTLHLRHVVLPARYLLASPAVTIDSMLQDVSDHGSPISRIFPLTQPQLWRRQRTELRQRRYDELGSGRQELVGGHFSAATGATVYLGDAFPEEFRGNAFVADANGNIVHRDVLTASGATLVASRRPPDREFLASRDRWFRPVNFSNGPDGNLYVVDFYREYIEEPVSIPETYRRELQLDFYRGTRLGRIYRIRPEREEKLSLSALGGTESSRLLPLLAHPNGWVRRTSQRLLVAGGDPSIAPQLRGLSADESTPLGRIHALWTLQGVGQLASRDVERALEDSEGQVRRQALRLAETLLGEESVQRILLARLPGLLRDENPGVAFQAALTAGLLHDSRPLTSSLATLSLAHPESKWLMEAILLTSAHFPAAFLEELFIRPSTARPPGPSQLQLVRQLCVATGAGRRTSRILSLLRTLDSRLARLDQGWYATCLEGVAEGLELTGPEPLPIPSARPILRDWIDRPVPSLQVSGRSLARHLLLQEYLVEAPSEVMDAALSIPIREAALRMLGRAPWSVAAPVLDEVLGSAVSQSMKSLAVRVAGMFDEPEALRMLLQRWRFVSPALRRQIQETMLRRPEWTMAFLEAVEQQRVFAQDVDGVTRATLLEHPSERIRRRADRLLAGLESGERVTLVEEYAPALSRPGDPARGSEIFAEHCASCHVAQGDRARIGPNLSGVNNQTRDVLLRSILDPSASVAPAFTNYVVQMRDGRVMSGLLVGETATALTLRGERQDITLLRRQIEAIRASSVSMMPEGLEQQIPVQDMAHLISYLRAGL